MLPPTLASRYLHRTVTTTPSSTTLVDTDDLEDLAEARRGSLSNGATGQIRVGKKLGADAGSPDQREDELIGTDRVGRRMAEHSQSDNIAGNSQYVLRVKATDPSGAF